MGLISIMYIQTVLDQYMESILIQYFQTVLDQYVGLILVKYIQIIINQYMGLILIRYLQTVLTVRCSHDASGILLMLNSLTEIIRHCAARGASLGSCQSFS